MRCVGALLLLLLVSGCSSPSRDELRVGVDPSWFPLAVPGREQNITGFSTELLKEIAKIQKLSTTKVTVNWDDLVDGLHNNKYNAILSSMPPYAFNRQTYDFSELYLTTGPVLMVASDSPITSLKTIKGKEIAVIPDARGAMLLEKYPGVILRPYDSIPKALNDIVKGEVDGALVNILSAVAYCQDLYQNKLKIVTPVLSNEGLRLITVKDGGDWVSHFNRGLAKLKSSGAYDKLLLKWDLKERCQP